MLKVHVRLADPIAGRRLTGPGCLLGTGTMSFLYKSRDLPDGSGARLMPNVVGLSRADAVSLLQLQGLHARAVGTGDMVVAQEPAVDEIVAQDHAPPREDPPPPPPQTDIMLTVQERRAADPALPA
jgi:hypothetical protein